jgi:tripartite ATP-independent transporter DctP family solute receptor
MKKISMLMIVAGAAFLAAPAANAQVQERNIRVSNGVNEDHPAGRGVAVMRACMAEKSGGKLKLQGFWGGALGGDLQATQALRAGTQEMVVTSSSPLAGIIPELAVFDLPFMFNDEKEADAILDGDYGKWMASKFDPAGLVVLAWWENGFRNLTNSRRPVAKADDINGLKVRVMQNNVYIDSFKTLGANALPMAFGEVFAAMETKAIDGQENPLVTIETSKMYEVQKYLTLSKHAYTPFPVLYSKKLFDGLSADEKKIMVDCAVAGRAEERKVNREMNAKALGVLKEKGMIVSELSAPELAKMREATKPVYERNRAAMGPETLSRLEAALAALRK